MALVAADKQYLEELIHREALQMQNHAAGLLARLEQRLDLLEQRLQAGLSGVGQLIPRTPKASELVAELRSELLAVPAGTVGALREALPRLFLATVGADSPAGQPDDPGPLSSRWWVTETEVSVVAIGGVIKWPRGKVIDERSHDVRQLRERNIPIRRLYLSELRSYGVRED